MAEQRAQRQLSAILAADVAGYSRLIGLDEEGMLARLKELRRALIDPKINEHRGRIVKTMGDGLLVQFASAVDAVRCAVDTQRQMAEQNAGIEQALRIDFRLGINVGDVVIDGDDIHGDGVNIAARLEALAQPGGICVSGSVHDQVCDKLDVTFVDAGERQLKNIARPVKVYQLRLEGTPRSSVHSPFPLPNKPSIVVLPFANMTGDPEQQYFADGLTENLITDISKFRDLFVIASNTSFSYKGKAVKVREVSRELGVRFALEGSVQRALGRVRITAQLIDGETGEHLWSERYDRPIEDTFAVQDEVTETIVGTLATAYGGRLRKAWHARARAGDTRNLEAVDYFQRGLEALNHFTPHDVETAKELFGKAIELDPNYGKPLAKMAWCHFVDASEGWSRDFEASWAQGFHFAKLAVERDDGEAWGYWALAGYYQHLLDYDRAIAEYRRALELNANDADVITDYAWCLRYAGLAKEALEMATRAIRLNPHYPEWYLVQFGQIHFDARQYQEAISTFRRLRQLNTVVHQLYLAASCAAVGELSRAAAAIEAVLKLDPHASIGKFGSVDMAPYRNAEDREHFIENLRRAGLPE